MQGDEQTYHLGVGEPEFEIGRVHIEGALEDGAGAGVLLLGRLPIGVLDPCGDVAPRTTNHILELLSLPPPVLGQLLVVLHSLTGLGDGLFRKVGRLAEQLLGCNLRALAALTQGVGVPGGGRAPGS